MYALRAYSYTRARVCMYMCVQEYMNIFPRAYMSHVGVDVSIAVHSAAL